MTCILKARKKPRQKKKEKMRQKETTFVSNIRSRERWHTHTHTHTHTHKTGLVLGRWENDMWDLTHRHKNTHPPNTNLVCLCHLSLDLVYWNNCHFFLSFVGHVFSLENGHKMFEKGKKNDIDQTRFAIDCFHHQILLIQSPSNLLKEKSAKSRKEWAHISWVCIHCKEKKKTKWKQHALVVLVGAE